MKRLSKKVVALTAIAVLSLAGLAVLAIVSGRYDSLLVGLIAATGVGVLVLNHQALTAQAGQLRKLTIRQNRLIELAKGIGRLEGRFASSPRMLEGSPERQIAETAARFDWLARRHVEDAERLDSFMDDLESSLVRRHEELLAQLHAQSSVERASVDDPGPGTAGSAP